MKVHIELSNRRLRDHEIFLEENQRLSDALNDDRAFLPVYDADGTFIIIPKRSIESIREVRE